MRRSVTVPALLLASALGGALLVIARRGRNSEAALPPTSSDVPFARLLHPGVRLIDSFALETRDPIWAGQMEQKLVQRFSNPPPERLGIGALRFGEVECRRTICRVVASYP